MEVVLLTPLFSVDKRNLYRKGVPDPGGSRATHQGFDHLVELAMTHDPFLRSACCSCARQTGDWILVSMHEPNDLRREDLISVYDLATATTTTNLPARNMRLALALVGVDV